MRMNQFSQWSEVHELPRVAASKLANIVLRPGKFLVAGPAELISMTQATTEIMAGQDPEDIKWAVYQIWSHWHVICSVSGDKILICDLRYWDLNGLIYSSPE